MFLAAGTWTLAGDCLQSAVPAAFLAALNAVVTDGARS